MLVTGGLRLSLSYLKKDILPKTVWKMSQLRICIRLFLSIGDRLEISFGNNPLRHYLSLKSSPFLRYAPPSPLRGRAAREGVLDG